MERMGQTNMDDLSSTMRSKMDDVASSARAKVDEFVSGAKAQARNLKTKSFEDIIDGTVSYVKDNPGKAILVSVAAGVILGAMMRRRGGDES